MRSSIRSMSRGLRRGFTLIELLTVIAIIGILAAIIIPVVGKVRQSAKNAVCASNLRQIGLAINLYSTSNKELFPLGQNQSKGYLGWQREIAPYFSQRGADYTAEGGKYLACPIETVQPVKDSETNYGCNPNIMPDRANDTGRISRSRVTNPSNTVMVSDSLIKTVEGYSPAPQLYQQPDIFAGGAPEQALPRATGVLAAFSFRHNDKVQCVFVDGHVASFLVGELLRRHVQLN